jgi:hypothetical protein
MSRVPGLLTSERTAAILIERHGVGAFDHAARQLAVLNLADKRDSVADWRAIATAIQRLQAAEQSRQ